MHNVQRQRRIVGAVAAAAVLTGAAVVVPAQAAQLWGRTHLAVKPRAGEQCVILRIHSPAERSGELPVLQSIETHAVTPGQFTRLSQVRKGDIVFAVPAPNADCTGFKNETTSITLTQDVIGGDVPWDLSAVPSESWLPTPMCPQPAELLCGTTQAQAQESLASLLTSTAPTASGTE